MIELDEPLTAEQTANLTKLADFLDALPADYAHFKMTTYVGLYDLKSEDDDRSSIIHEYDLGESDTDRVLNCGTCACAVGHGPLAGVKPEPEEDWADYEQRAFGVAMSGSNFDAWEFMFGPANENDAKAAAARIREVIAA